MLHAVIMAGGAGTRFWPASRRDRPKQLLDLAAGRTMLQATVDRLEPLVPPERTLILTNQRLVDAVRAQLPQLPARAVVGEPSKRDTAPCIGVAAVLARHADPDATLVVMPSDHLIEPVESFVRAIRQAVQLVEESPSRLITFGIRPSYPAESFGYIQRGASLPGDRTGSLPAYQVSRFREKPKADVARQFLQEGGYYWNSGIFVWKATTILAELALREPAMSQHLERIGDFVGTPQFPGVLQREFTAIVGKSIDFAVMEHATDTVVVEAPFEWDDVGSWQAWARMRGADSHGNTTSGRHLGIDTTGSIIHGRPDHLLVTVGLTDCLVIHTPDATLVANKRDEERVREVVQQLERLDWQEYL